MPLVTYTYIGLCILIFLVDTATRYLGLGNSQTGYLSLLGMRSNPLITLGQVWRLVTPMFLHGGISHLFMNCFALYVWGRYAEAFYGKSRYIAILLLSGITGCVAGYALSSYNALGASGAIFGIFGAFLAFRKSHKQLYNTVFGVQILVYVLFNLVTGFMSQGVDNLGHLGGLAGGYLAGCTLGMVWEKHYTPREIAAWCICTLVLGGLLVCFLSRVLLIQGSSGWMVIFTLEANVCGLLFSVLGVLFSAYISFLLLSALTGHRLKGWQIASGFGYLLLTSAGILAGYIQNYHFLLQ